LRSARIALFLLVIAYLLGVFAPDVFLLVAIEGATLNESILALDCTILLCTISALNALIDPNEGFDAVYSCCNFSILFTKNFILL